MVELAARCLVNPGAWGCAGRAASPTASRSWVAAADFWGRQPLSVSQARRRGGSTGHHRVSSSLSAGGVDCPHHGARTRWGAHASLTRLGAWPCGRRGVPVSTTSQWEATGTGKHRSGLTSGLTPRFHSDPIRYMRTSSAIFPTAHHHPAGSLVLAALSSFSLIVDHQLHGSAPLGLLQLGWSTDRPALAGPAGCGAGMPQGGLNSDARACAGLEMLVAVLVPTVLLAAYRLALPGCCRRWRWGKRCPASLPLR